MSTQMIIRIDEEIKNKFSKLVRMEGKTVSEKIRELISEYAEEKDIGKYIDDLWNRIGTKAKRKGYSLSDVDKIIREVRKEKRSKY